MFYSNHVLFGYDAHVVFDLATEITVIHLSVLRYTAVANEATDLEAMPVQTNKIPREQRKSALLASVIYDTATRLQCGSPDLCRAWTECK